MKELVETNSYINVSSVRQLQKTSLAFKQEQPFVLITHILDSGFDDQDLFRYIDEKLQIVTDFGEARGIKKSYFFQKISPDNLGSTKSRQTPNF